MRGCGGHELRGYGAAQESGRPGVLLRFFCETESPTHLSFSLRLISAGVNWAGCTLSSSVLSLTTVTQT